MGGWRRTQNGVAAGGLRRAALVLLATLVAGVGVPTRTVAGPILDAATHAECVTLIDAACAPLALGGNDLVLPADAAPRDPFRLALVERLLGNPLSTAATVDALGAELCTGTTVAPAVVRAAAALGDGGPPPAPSGRTGGLGDRLEELVQGALWPIEAGLRASWDDLDSDEVAEVAHLLRDVLSLEEPPEDLTIDALATEDRLARARSERLVELLARIDRPALNAALVESAARLDAIVAHLLERADKLHIRSAQKGDAPASGDVEAWVRLRDGRAIVIGGPGRTVYHEACVLSFDRGGDDVYEGAAWAAEAGRVSLVVDLGGDDTYRGGEGSVASGVFGIGWLLDRAGNDVYEASGMGLGAALVGLGVLVDEDGDDRYLLGSFGQGAATFGVGLLRDLSGTDLYQGGGLCQGFGFVGGLGLLDDRRGRDVYLCHSQFSDLLRDEATSVHLAQGFGYGLRPYASGGIGLLVDGGGHDRYSCDVFGQGSAYYYALGGLLDRDGNDVFAGYNYTQGAGVHIAVGALLDGGGDDSYRTTGVSQGCGHDLAYGVLVDAGGSDDYAASGLAQGAGNANGIGVLVDLGGDDQAVTANDRTSLGYGNFRRHFGSVGLAIFAGGQTRFLDAVAAPGALWQKGTHGLGVAAERADILALREAARGRPALVPSLPAPAEEPEPLPSLDPLEQPIELAERDPALARLPVSLLFGRAARGEPRFRDERDRAFAELVRRGGAVVDSLVVFLDTKVARERHTLKDLFRSIGEPAEQPLARALSHPREGAAGAAAWCLERMEARTVEAELIVALELHDSFRVRTAAAQALGRAGGVSSIKPLLTGLENEHASVRKASAFALGQQAILARRAARGEVGRGPAPANRQRIEVAIPALIQQLADEHYGARYAAAWALGRFGPWATRALVGALDGAEPRTQVMLIEGLRFGDDPRAVPILEQLAREPAPVGPAAQVAAAFMGHDVAFRGNSAASSAARMWRADALRRATELLDRP